MSYKSLSNFISALEFEGELVRITEFVSPRLEISEITDRVCKNNGKALLFENNGTPFPLLINGFGSEKRMCLALGVDNLDAAGEYLGKILKVFLGTKESVTDKLKVLPALKEVSSWMPRLVNRKGKCQEVIMDQADITKLPVLTCWPADGGPFVTLPVVHTRDPESGIRNQGMYRMEVFGPTLTGMHWHLHKGSAHHFLKYKERGEKMPVSVTLGGDPVYTYAATAPLPENLDEYILAGFLRKKKVELVKCLTNDLQVPGDVDFVIEGYIDPEEEFIMEGPFGDHTGFYSLADWYPRFHITCITHRKDAIYPATIVGIPPMEDGWIGKATERLFLLPMKLTTVPEITDINMPVAGVFHNIVLTKIEKTYPGQAIKVMNSLWGAGQMMFNKIMVVVSGDVDLTDYKAVAGAVSQNTDPLHDIHFSKGPVDILDHSSRRFAFGSKMGIDATLKLPEELEITQFEHQAPQVDAKGILVQFPDVCAINGESIDGGLSMAVLTLKKDRSKSVRELCVAIFHRKLIKGVKFLIFLDQDVDSHSFFDVAWLTANNIDPGRDCFSLGDENENSPHVLIIDGTRKIKGTSGFDRDWPNVIVMDENTIRNIDQKWEKFGLGALIHSPSEKYRTLIINQGAVVL
jgi:4-hydroxy-3-polyprenylbenzoate decarboxylase